MDSPTPPPPMKKNNGLSRNCSLLFTYSDSLYRRVPQTSRQGALVSRATWPVSHVNNLTSFWYEMYEKLIDQGSLVRWVTGLVGAPPPPPPCKQALSKFHMWNYKLTLTFRTKIKELFVSHDIISCNLMVTTVQMISHFARALYIPTSYIQSSPHCFFQWIQEKRGKF